jgi:Xaa-Pro aminopeptidase
VSDRRSQRLAALVESLSVAHLDGLLVTSLPNIRYLTGFSGTSALLFVTARDVFLVTDFRYQTQVRAEVGDLAQVVIESQSLWNGLWQLLAQATYVEVAGFESPHIVHRDFQRLVEAGARPCWRATSDLVETLRERKDASEVERIRAAASMATSALGMTLPVIKAGMTELEVAGVLEKSIRDAGSEAFPFPSIVASGPRRVRRLLCRHHAHRGCRKGEWRATGGLRRRAAGERAGRGRRPGGHAGARGGCARARLH